MPDPGLKTNLSKQSFWIAFAFYALIAFEFLYMSSPFAVYFYSAYLPELDFLNESPNWAWLGRFVLPHIAVDTSSMVVNLHNLIGAVLALGGFTAFCIGAFQVYRNKLLKRGPVTGGVYDVIRHPQYVSFAICSLGLLVMWPRYLVIVAYVTLLFAYYLLARIEERECESSFGDSYRAYKARTAMFVPIPAPSWWPKLPESGVPRLLGLIAAYILTLAFGLTAAWGVETLSLNSLFTHTSSNAVSLSAARIDEATLKSIVDTGLADARVRTRIEDSGKDALLLNYVMPEAWCIPEVPMGACNGHDQPANYDATRYKIVVTRVDLRNPAFSGAPDFLRQVKTRIPVAIVHVDASRRAVLDVTGPASDSFYRGIPVAIY